ncbi:DUF2232 domain-containing protein [Cyanobacteria bacterium FACHB-63]|nr:DUF2232 domain-containing protein [Cyanobacteria bacterium FACHB-63]
MTELPNDDRSNQSVNSIDLDEEWIPDVDPEPDFADQPPVRRRVDPDSPIVMVETAFLASAASLVWLVNTYFPMGPFLQIFFPIPIALIYLRWGSRAAWMGCVIAGLLLSVLMAPVRSIQYVIPYGLMGVLLGALWYRRVKWFVSIPIGMLLGVLGAFFRVWLVSLLLGDDLWQYGTIQVTNFLDWIFSLLGLLIQPSLALVQLFIFLSIIAANTVYLFVVHLVAWFLFDRLNNPIPRPPHWVQVIFDNE